MSVGLVGSEMCIRDSPYTEALLQSIPKLNGTSIPIHNDNAPNYAEIPKFTHPK